MSLSLYCSENTILATGRHRTPLVSSWPVLLRRHRPVLLPPRSTVPEDGTDNFKLFTEGTATLGDLIESEILDGVETFAVLERAS